jgi:hypothetical protein
MIADKYLGSGMAILEKEIDVVFHQGLAWAEVKNYQQTLDIKELGRLKALDRIDTILDFFAEVKAMTGKEMKLHYFFLRGGVTREVKDLLIAKGVVVHNAPDIPFALRPN